jgi:iron complex transport system substrate-binding protein
MSRNNWYKKTWGVACASLLALTLAACGDNETSETENTNESATEQTADNKDKAAEATTRTVVDALGNEVEVPINPKRVIATYLEDNLVALGVTPVAQWSVKDGTSIQDYLQDSLKDVPVIPHDLPFEAVQSYQPDLIIMDSASMVEGDKYEQYKKIAPTYVIGKEVNNDWRDELLRVGEVFDKKAEAEAALKAYDEKAAAAKAEIEAKAGNPSVAAVWLVSGSFFIVADNLSSGAVLYGDLGLKEPEVVKEISASATGNWSAISLEKLVELDADHLFIIDSESPENPAVLSDKLWQSIPAVKAGNVHTISSQASWLYTGTIANTQIIDDVVETLTK